MAKELVAGRKNNQYKIYIGQNSISKKNLVPLIKSHKKLLIISDSGVPKEIIQKVHHISKATSKIFAFTLNQGESSKSLGNFQKIINFLIEQQFDRSDAIIAVGGGVVGDISGYVASSYLRGIQFIQIPTTLLAQVDSSVGGKTAINISAGKNLVGAFYNPKGVIIDTSSLHSLPTREFRAGLAEVIKYGLIQNKKLLSLLSHNIVNILGRQPGIVEQIIYESLKTKSKIVTQDEKETGIRAILNFGHTFGHAIEAHEKYKKILHGEAVAKGMLVASKISCLEGCISEKDFLKISALLEAYGFDLSLDQYKYLDLKPFIFRDKKMQGGSLNLILLTGLSKAFVTNSFNSKNLKLVLS
ncbi:MAG: 3-dehydroquinate synthase [SAR86 cluster bacterium BACL1 MAG-121105-bin34]|jgi:3-dehydroquinate synthase|uniref:3-dehydroquinate synthase n=2 Tax=SAR86 cluster TaxID=62672 RepID=A0A0R2U8S1_9GAMM|nr:MAG: 3-dehydroquinate synthase [SAR86 cluster bacterium BACL1 MAG-120507-bin14]KRO95953.1 MAG: 3-dehydroquinate synthase [SAR86 cluster bacterium BACL1 MAG-120820-bin45]KRO97632.1 MAG: 3-dehydroquinate synthase [SAR86 cluster bacterium BACL1 MAG-120828-bin5]KRO99281.1 MAG: 3-dehydroquinate synthase [SAR86 cluster bacterium BACL1 MAG-120823-bin87]KRP00204.1 MAG: 3-dehydroquinate synthase [SAR86 cluster bacterium BACL1 MAG-120813-bin36]KRP02452.1 MAG: 3-dehydroquinate synthase [SAR86 cluster 